MPTEASADRTSTDPAAQVTARLPVTDRALWLWLVGAGLVVVGAVLWLALGRAPEVVVGKGMIVPSQGFVEVGTASSGAVTEVLVEPGDDVAQGEVVARLTETAGRVIEIASSARGVVGTVLVRQGGVTEPGTPLMTIDPVDDGNIATGFLPADQASRVVPGMRATVAIASAPKSEYGAIEGTVASIAVLPATASRIDLVVGGNEQLPSYFLADGPVVEVTVALDEDPSTPTGYGWTIGQGPPTEVRTGTLAEITVTVGDGSLLSRLTQ